MTSGECDLALRALETEWMEAHRLRQMAVTDLHRHDSGEHAELIAMALVRVSEMERLKKEIIQRSYAIEDSLLD